MLLAATISVAVRDGGEWSWAVVVAVLAQELAGCGDVVARATRSALQAGWRRITGTRQTGHRKGPLWSNAGKNRSCSGQHSTGRLSSSCFARLASLLAATLLSSRCGRAANDGRTGETESRRTACGSQSDDRSPEYIGMAWDCRYQHPRPVTWSGCQMFVPRREECFRGCWPMTHAVLDCARLIPPGPKRFQPRPKATIQAH
jgi:hypothetical protein